MSIVTQEPVLFNDTIAANIALGTPDASMEEIEKAAKVANAPFNLSYRKKMDIRQISATVDPNSVAVKGKE